MHVRKIHHFTEINTNALTSWRIAQSTGFISAFNLKQILQLNGVQGPNCDACVCSLLSELTGNVN